MKEFQQSFNNQPILDVTNLEDAINQLNDQMLRTLNKVAPLKSRRCVRKTPKSWFNKDLLNQRKIIKSREPKWLKDKEPHQWTAFKRERNCYNRMMKFQKRHNTFTRIKDNHNNTRQLYKIISSLTRQDNTNSLPEAHSDQELAEHFAEFFLQKIEAICKKFSDITPYITEPINVPQLTKFSPINEPGLLKIISMMPSKSCELDNMGTDKIKEILHTCIQSITKIVNLSLSKDTFSNQWKTAIVKPLFKDKKRGTAYTNYRPVSSLSFISKVVERYTLQQLTQHCNINTLLLDFQSAYQKHHGCEMSLLKLTNNILWGMENQQATAMIILDLSAAFDTVDHELLLQVLNHKFGVTGMALDWYKNYLIPRKFKVSINGTYSNEKTMNFSIPKGSVQGAFLFIAYASTIQDVMKKDIILTGFPDDHSVCKQFKSGTRQE